MFFLVSIPVALVACDSGGGASSEESSNQSPSVEISAPENGSEYGRRDTIVFEGSATDPETGSLNGSSLEWQSVSDGPIGQGERVSTPDLPPNAHTVILAATDSLGETARDTVSVNVNGPPTVSINSPSDESGVNKGEAVALEGAASDPVNGDLTGGEVEWESDVDGSIGSGQSDQISSLSAGPHTISLTATDEDGKVTSDSVEIVIEEQGFNVRFRFLSDFTESQKKTIRQAVRPWKDAITADLSPYFIGEEIASSTPFREGGVDDVLVAVQIRDLDGQGGTLAQAAPVTARMEGEEFTTSSSGFVQIDEADLNNSRLETIVTHEIGHVLGIGTTWDAISGQDTVNPYHTGSSTTSAFEAFGGSDAYLGEGVPLQRVGGPGTAGAHWAEGNFDNELMTGNLNSDSENPLSRVTLAGLEDIGYQIDPQAAETYSLPDEQETFIPAEADATLSRPTLAGANFGAPDGGDLDSVLVAGSNNDQLWLSAEPENEVLSSLIRFDVPSSVPEGVSAAASLILRSQETNAQTTGHDIGIYRATEGWSETSVTYDSRPARGDSVSAFDFQTCDPFCGESRPNVTGPVQDWLSGADNNGLYLRAPDADSDPTFSIGIPSRHIERKETRVPVRPFLFVLASESSAALQANTMSSGLNPIGPKSTSDEEIRLGDDILDLTVYGKNAEGNIVKRKRLR